MQKKLLRILFGAEALLCVALAVSGGIDTGLAAGLLAFPLSPLGSLLRRMSLSGPTGNIAAVALFVLSGFLPLLLLLPVHRKHCGEDVLPVLLCPMVWLSLYGVINPALLTRHFGSMTDPAMCAMLLNGCALSVAIAYGILRLLCSLPDSAPGKLLHMAVFLLYTCIALFVFAAFYICVRDFMSELFTLHAGNTGSGSDLVPSRIFLFLRLLIHMLPYLGDIWISFAALDMVKILRADDAHAAVSAAEILSRRCRQMLSAVVLTQMGFNLLQLLCAPVLRVLNGSVDFPILSLLLVLTALLAAQLIHENKRLHDDNELFI